MRLRGLKQLPLYVRVVYGVAIDATYVVSEMLRAQEVSVFFSKLMAAQAPLGRLLSRQPGKTDDLLRISGLCVFLARPVAAFTALPLYAVLVMQCLPMRSLVEGLSNLFMASFAGLCADIL